MAALSTRPHKTRYVSLSSPYDVYIIEIRPGMWAGRNKQQVINAYPWG